MTNTIKEICILKYIIFLILKTIFGLGKKLKIMC